MTTPKQIVDEARSWAGTRWAHQAMLKSVKTDCFGLILGVALELNLPGSRAAADDPRLKGYGREPNYALALEALREYMIEIRKEEAEIGDVLYLRVPRGVDPQHFAIISQANPPYMIHAWAQNRGVVENRIDEAWDSRIAHVFRFRGVG